MLKQAMMAVVSDVVMGLAAEIYEAVKDAPDTSQAKAKLRGVLKAHLHEQVHNAITRALR